MATRSKGAPAPTLSRRVRSYFTGPRRPALLAAVIALVILLGAWWQSNRWYRAHLLAGQRDEFPAEVIPYGNALSAAISRRVTLLEGLSAFVEAELSTAEGLPESEFEVFAADLHENTKGVRNLSIAPGGVQQSVYPLAGNEAVLGHNLLQDERPDVRADVQRAIRTGQITLSGPYELRQGGLGLVGRQAIYQDDEFWGLTAIVVDIPSVLEDAGLSHYPDYLVLAIRDGPGNVFYGQSAVFEQNPLIYRVELPGGAWELAGLPRGGWSTLIDDMSLHLFQASSLVIVGLLVGLIYLIANRQARLTRAVKQRTEAIARINQQLKRDIAERQEAEEALRRRTEELAALRATSLDLSAQLELPALLEGVVRRAVELLGANGGGALYLYDPDQEELEMVISHSLQTDDTGTRLRVGEGVSGRIVATGEPLIVQDYAAWEGHSPVYDEMPVSAIIGVPLRWQDRILGVINVIDTEDHTSFTERDLHLLEAFAQQAAVAIENARLFVAVEQHAGELETLHRISLTLTSSLELADVLDAVLEGAFRLMPDAEDAHIFLYHDDRLTFGAVRWADGHTSDPFAEVRDEGLTYTVARRGEPMVVSNAGEHPLFKDAFPDWNGSIVGLPLKIGERVVGVMNVAYTEPREFSEAELRILRLLGDQAAVAIENARLFEAEHTARQQAETLREVAAALSSTLDLEALLGQVLRELQKVVPYDSASIQLLRDGHVEIIAGHGFPKIEQVIGMTFTLTADNPNSDVVARKEPLLVQDAKAAYADFKKAPHKHIRSWLGAPLIYKDQVIGMITLDRTQVDAFSQADANIAMTFAHHVAIALENARLYEETRLRAITDGLTGLYNVRYFYEVLEQEIQRSRRYQHPCSLIMLDLDNFKMYNDRYGHLAGDDLLRELSSLIQEEIRKIDVAARYGGEEFMIILPETEKAQAASLAKRLWIVVRTHQFMIRETQEVGQITASLGVATCPDDAHSAEGLVNVADFALLQAKEKRDSVYVAGTPPASP